MKSDIRMKAIRKALGSLNRAIYERMTKPEDPPPAPAKQEEPPPAPAKKKPSVAEDDGIPDTTFGARRSKGD